MRLFLGVDGGQSSTTAVIGEDTGRVLGRGTGGPCNHASGAEGRARLERALRESVAAACADAGLASPVRFEAACLGMSGGPEDKRAIIASVVDCERLIVTNDAAIALSGATASGHGIIVIAGTGSIAWGRNEAGKVARAGGWGYIFGDEGSAFDIARQALRAALRMEEDWGPETVLRARLLAAAGAQDANTLLHAFYTPEWPRDRVATLAPLVDQAAGDRDRTALDVLHYAALQLATLAMCIRPQLWGREETVEVAFLGGVFRSGFVRERFQALLEIEPNTTCGPARLGPAEGALREAIRAASVVGRM